MTTTLNYFEWVSFVFSCLIVIVDHCASWTRCNSNDHDIFIQVKVWVILLIDNKVEWDLRLFKELVVLLWRIWSHEGFREHDVNCVKICTFYRVPAFLVVLLKTVFWWAPYKTWTILYWFMMWVSCSPFNRLWSTKILSINSAYFDPKQYSQIRLKTSLSLKLGVRLADWISVWCCSHLTLTWLLFFVG